jgi:DNA processing protein
MTSLPQNSPDIEKWIALVRADGVGPTTFARLLKHFGSVDRALGASVSQFCGIERIGDKTAREIAASIGRFDVEKELALARKLGVWIIHAADERYPKALRSIYDPPPVLYIKGTLERCDSLAVAIVGSRRCSTYGSEQASRFAYTLAAAGFTVVSGMARGIDTAAHRGALSASGRTIAVQGCGLGKIFPPENDRLFQSISEDGACISELPLEYDARSENFPARNRIIAGLCIGVIVVEATARSGALLTAEAALAYNREVLAVPGKIDSPLAKGTHNLIKQGATLVDSIEDIMDALGSLGDRLKDHVGNVDKEVKKNIDMPLFDISQLNLSESEKAVLGSLDSQPVGVEDVIMQTGLGAGAVNSALISLRLKGLIAQLPGSLFLRR